MTLIYDEPHEPGLHALIIGVEDSPGPFSCADSAASVAEWLQSFEARGTKLASIDLLVLSAAGPEPFYRRQKGSDPRAWSAPVLVGNAVNGWRERLQGHGQNAAFFYFSGPTAYHESKTALILPQPIRSEPAPHVIDLDNLWRGMGDLPQRQLFFIESSPSHRSDDGLDGSLLLLPAGRGAARGPRARYLGRVPPIAGQSPDAGPLSAALREALDHDGLINTRTLGESLGAAFGRRLRAMGVTAFEPLETVYEGDFAVPSLFANLGRVVSADGSPEGAGRAENPARQDGVPERTPQQQQVPQQQTPRDRPAPQQQQPQRFFLPSDDPDPDVPAEALEEGAEGTSAGAPADEMIARIAGLSDRQRLCLHLLREGRTIPRIARTLDISVGMVDSALRSAMGALGVETYEAAAALLTAQPAAAGPVEPEPEVPPAERIARLSNLHRVSLHLLSEGKTTAEIARITGVSDESVAFLLRDAATLLAVPTPAEAAALLAAREAALGLASPAARDTPGDGGEGEIEPSLPDGGRAADEGADVGESTHAGVEALLRGLTSLQREYLRLVAQGRTSKEIAWDRPTSSRAVDTQITQAMRALGVTDRRAAARYLVNWEELFGELDQPTPAVTVAEAGETAALARSAPEANTHFVTDDPEVERDELNRGPLAIALGRRLHRIWCRSNGIRVPGDELVEAGGDERSAFVLHLDAPWGGGKTSFANFLARVLNPFPRGGSEAAKFLVERAGGAVGTIFIDDPPADGAEGGGAAKWPEDARRPWIVVNFNAWQAEHCTPPWWTFYQAIRKGCFASVWAEGRSAARPAQASAPSRPLVEERIWSWAVLWARELWWRVRNPKVVSRLSTFAVAAAVTAVLWQMGLIFRNQTGGLALDTANALGLALVGATTLSGLWSLGALLTESVAPGTDDLAERRSLGGGDPFERFRRHFCGMIAAVRRPVMVIVDDLDRCRPDFVVDLVRGIQTLLRSPRVVFVILGDRDWIERAFEAHHAAMSKVNVGPEQDFGARFVEKAIQMSFILPEMAEPSQDSYVRRVLIGPGGSVSAADAPAPPEIAQQLRSDYREKVAAAPTPEARKQAEGELLEQYRGELEVAATAGAVATGEAAPAGEIARAAAETAEQQAIKLVSEERALLAAVDEKMGQALLHRLEPLARFFPPNPRQIKRIVNAITMYTAVAYLQMDMDESDPRGVELAIWVIIMTEWPKTWRVLASCPRLADLLAEEEPEAALAAIDESALPGSRASTLREINRIRADRDLMALITEADEDRPRLSSESVELFVRLTPLYSRKQRLAGEADPGAGDERPRPRKADAATRESL